MNGTMKQVAVITGGGSGMGEAVAKHLAKKSWDIAILDMNEQSGEAVAKRVGGVFHKTDVTSQESQEAAFAAVWEKYGQIDFVFANAGIVEKKGFLTKEEGLPPPKLSTLVMDVCLNGVVFSTYLAMHYMRQNPHNNGGSVIMNSSSAGIYPSYALPLYAAAKHGVVGFMRSIAGQLKKENIRVNATLPGAVRTNLCSGDVWDMFPADQFTTIDNIVDTVVKLLEDPSLIGKAAEISMGNVYYREQAEFCDEQMKAIMGAAGEAF